MDDATMRAPSMNSFRLLSYTGTLIVRSCLVLAISGWLLAGETASAEMVLNFYNITGNSATDSSTGGQYSVTVIGSTDTALLAKYNGGSGDGSIGSNQVLFVFQNTAAVQSTIAQVYFQDGTLLAIAPPPRQSGVSFTEQTASPGDLPGGNNLTPDFSVTREFLAGANPSPAKNGIAASSDYLGIVFNLQNGQTYNDVINALSAGYNDPTAVWNPNGTDIIPDGVTGLRIGIHVIGYGDGKSESFVNSFDNNSPPPAVMPLPSSFILGGIGGVALLGCWYRRRCWTRLADLNLA
jgi:hypothetical protein